MSGFLPLIDGLLSLATSVVDYMGLKEAHKYIDRVRALQLQILEEESRDPNSIIDVRIEKLEAELKIEVESLKTAVMGGLTKPSNG